MTTTLHTEKLRRPSAVWWTLLVAVLFALAPTLTHALDHLGGAGAAGVQRIEICTSQGPQTVAPDTAHAVDSPIGQDSTSTPPHCAFCLHQADRIAPPPQLLPYLLTLQGGQQEIADWQAFFYFDKTPLWAPPRGPPLAIAS
jgi:anti-sigma factor RsiW